MIQNSDNVLFRYVVLIRYVSQYDLESNDDLKRFLRLYPMYREEIIDFTATWRALSILDKILPVTERLKENIGAVANELTPDESPEIDSAAAQITVQGARHPEKAGANDRSPSCRHGKRGRS